MPYDLFISSLYTTDGLEYVIFFIVGLN